MSGRTTKEGTGKLIDGVQPRHFQYDIALFCASIVA
jgi:hypothetical protein